MFKTLKEKLVLVAILALLGAGGYIWYLSGEIDDVQKNLDKKTGELQKIKVDSEKKIASSVATEEVLVEVSAKEKEVEKKVDKIVERAKIDVENIKKESAEKPQTPAEVEKKIDAVSQRRVDALWESYCGIYPAAPACAIHKLELAEGKP